MAQRVRRDAGQLGLGDHLGPKPLRALVVPFAGLAGNTNSESALRRHRFKQHQGGNSQRPDRPSGLAVGKDQQATFEVDLRPAKPGDLVAPAAGQRPKSRDLDRLDVRAFFLQHIEGFAKTLHLIERQEPLRRLSVLRTAARSHGLLGNQPSLARKAENCRKIAHDFAGGAVTASNDDALARS